MLFWLVVSRLLVLGIILFSQVGLMPDEAQYWIWSKMLSYCYYSKPAGIAWQVAAGCSLFGDTELGVRFGSLILSCGLLFALYSLAKSCGLDEKRRFWAVVAFAFCPLGIFSGFFATTDCAYVLFWTAALVAAAYERFLLVGVVVALGALWKWPIYAVFLPIILVHRNRQILYGMLISVLGLVPSLIWNLQTDFLTFRHVQASIANAAKPNPLEFLGAQLALVSPILFILIVVGMWRSERLTKPQRLCWLSSLLFFLTLFAASFFEKVQGNWAVAAYPSAFVIMMLYATSRWVLSGITLSLLLIGVVPFLPYKSNPFKPGLGVEHIGQALIRSGYDPDKDILFSDRYQVTSLLSFYGPQQKRAYFFNLQQHRHNQFDLWPLFEKGSSGLFVEFAAEESVANRYKEQLEPYFADVTILPSQPLYGNHKIAVILRATNYNGLPLPETRKY